MIPITENEIIAQSIIDRVASVDALLADMSRDGEYTVIPYLGKKQIRALLAYCDYMNEPEDRKDTIMGHKFIRVQDEDYCKVHFDYLLV